MDKLQDYKNPYINKNIRTKKSENKKSNSKDHRNTPIKVDHNFTVNDILRETMPRMNAPQPSVHRQDVFLEELKDELPFPTKPQTTKSKKPVRPRNKSNFPETPILKPSNIMIPKTSGTKKLRSCVSTKSFKDQH